MRLVNEFENLQRHNEAERSPASLETAFREGLFKLRAILRDEKSLIGLANSFGGLLVFVLYLAVRP